MIYLDNAATTLKKPPCVAEAVVRAMATMGNSGRSAHQEALDASRVIYRTREQLARLLGCSAAERVVFTCNSTEALNIAIDGLFAPGDHVLSTDCEHNSVLRPLYRLEGVEVDFLPADRRGCIDYDDFRRLLRPNTRGIVCTHGSNLTGNLLDIRAIGRFAKEHGLLLVVDASQTAGVFDIDMEAMGIDVVLVTDNELESLFACDTIAQSMLRVLGKRNRTCVRNARDRKLKLRRQLGLPLEPRRTFEAVGSPSHFGEE